MGSFLDAGRARAFPGAAVERHLVFFMIFERFWVLSWKQFWTLGTTLERQGVEIVIKMSSSVQDCFPIPFLDDLE